MFLDYPCRCHHTVVSVWECEFPVRCLCTLWAVQDSAFHKRLFFTKPSIGHTLLFWADWHRTLSLNYLSLFMDKALILRSQAPCFRVWEKKRTIIIFLNLGMESQDGLHNVEKSVLSFYQFCSTGFGFVTCFQKYYMIRDWWWTFKWQKGGS